jgi:hypothetical protein
MPFVNISLARGNSSVKRYDQPATVRAFAASSESAGRG